MKNKIIKSILALLIICVLIILIIVIKNRNNYERPDYDYIALINHSINFGPDSGTIYTYEIYKSEVNSEYFYIKTKSENTIYLPATEDISSGSIKRKKDLEKIMKDIKKDSKKEENRLGYSDSSITYSYLNNGTYENYTNINEIGKKLFK